ncbi:MAG: filamentous hemagglutinin N-terminal domain-containing protein [Vulcanimicrobiota bacterium]
MKLGKLSNTALGFAILGLSGVAYANPEGPDVQHGQVNITGLGSALVEVLQQSPSAIVNWNQFSVGANEMVRFLQPGQHAVILNRVVGQNPSDILGQIQANGSVWLINPNGILFGPGSQINAGSFLASTLNISNADFLAGKFNFEQMKNPATGLPQDLRSVVNQGTITVTDGGYAVLMAPTVLNQGLVIANLGKVVMAAGEKATLSFDAGKLINFRVDGMTGEPGTVVIPQQAVSDLLSQVIKNDSVVEAGRLIPNADGSVALVHGSGLLVHEGTTRADGAAGQQAGSVSLEAAQSVVVGPSSTISASGQGQNSDGGSIRLNSGHMTATMAGSQLVATQGDSGLGGFIETSSKGAAWLRGEVNAGRGGTWLIDPRFINIINGSGGTADPALPTVSGGAGTQTVSETALQNVAAGSNIVLMADDTITVNDIADNLINLTSGTSITFTTTSGNFIFADPNDAIQVSGAGNLNLQIGQDVFLGHLVSTGTGTVSLQYGGQVFENGGAPAIRADNISFNLLAGSQPLNLDIAGFSNNFPLTLNLTAAAGTSFNLADPNAAGSHLILAGGTLTTTGTGYRTGPPAAGTNVTLTHSGGITLGQVDVGNFNLTETGAVATSGGANRLTTTNANISATGTINLNTAAANLTVTKTTSGNGVTLNELDGLNLLDVTVNGGDLNATGNGWNALFSGGPRTLTGNLNLGGAVTDFRLRDTSNNNIQIGAVTGNLITLASGNTASTSGGSILMSGVVPITATQLVLSTGGNTQVIGTTVAPILVNAGVQLTTRQRNGEIHVQGPTSTLNLGPAGAAGTLATTGTPGADFVSWIVEEFSTRSITFGPGGVGSAASPLATFQLISAGDILSDAGTLPDIFATNVRLRGANIGTAANNILVALQAGGVLDAFGTTSTFVTIVDNVGALQDLANWVINSGGNSQITANNGVVNVTGNNVFTTTGITTNAGTPAVNVSIQGTTATLGSGATPFSVTDSTGAADSRVAVNATTINGGVAGNDLVTTNANVRLTSGTGGMTVDTNTMGGNLTLESLGTGAGAITVNEATDLAGRDLTVRTTGASTASASFVGGIVTVGGTVSSNAGGLANLHLENTAGGLTVGIMVAGATNVTLFATGNVVENGDPAVDVTARNLYVQSGGNVDLDVALSGAFAGNLTGNLNLDTPGAITFDGSAVFPGATNFNGATLPGGTFAGGNAVVNATGNYISGFMQAGGNASVTAASIIDGIDNPASGNPPLNCPDIVGNTITLTTTGTIGVGGAGTLEVDALNLVVNNGGTANVNDCNTLSSVTVNTNNQAWSVGTNNGAETIGVSAGGTMSTTGATAPAIGRFTLNDARAAGNNITLANVDMTGNQLVLNLANAGIQDDSVQTTRVCAANLTLNAATGIGGTGANQDIDTCVTGFLTTNVTVAGAPTVFSQRDAGGALIAGPGNYTAITNNGVVNGTWAGSTLSLDNAGALNITSTGTGVSITRTGDIVLGTANVSNSQNIELVSTGGAILDDTTDGGSPQPDTNVDIIAANGRLRGTSIGTVTNPIEYTINGTIDAQSSTGGVFLASGSRTEHLVINTPGQDYQVSFLGADSGAAANVSFVSGALTQTGNAGGTDISLTNTGGGAFNDVTIASAVNNSVAGGQAEYIDIQVQQGSIFRTGPATNRIISDNVSFASATGSIGTAANPILTTTTNLCASTPTAGNSIFIDEADQLQNLLVYYNKPAGDATAQVAVNWLDAGGTANSLTVAPATGALNGRGNDTRVYLTNGNMDPSNTVSGGNIVVGRYTSGTTNPGNTTSLTLRARGGGSILDQAADGFEDINPTNFDLGGANNLILTAEAGSIGSLVNPIEVSNSTISAYTPFSGAGLGDIAIHGVGATTGTVLTFQQIFGGGGARPGVPVCAANTFVPPSETQVAGLSGNGLVQLSSNATIKAVDVQAGTTAVDAAGGNVSLLSRGGGDIQVESVQAVGNRIFVQTAGGLGGNVIDCTPATRTANFTARDLVLNLQGTGNFGQPLAKPTLNGIIDVSVENIDGTVADGGLYLHALSAVTIGGGTGLFVNDNTPGLPEPVLVIAEGTTTIGAITATVNGVGNNAAPNGARVHIETRNGADLLVGTVDAGSTGFVGLYAGLDSAQLAANNLVARTTATLEDTNGNTNNIVAGNVTLVAGGGIGEFDATGNNFTFLEITASGLAASTTAGSIRVNNLSPGTTTIDCITDAVCMAPYNVCGLTATGTGGNIILQSVGDVIINPAVNAATTPINANNLVCIESTAGSILDNNAVSALDINAPNIGLIANTNVGNPASAFNAPDHFVELDANLLAGRATNAFNIDDPDGYTVGDLTPLGCNVSGITSGMICLANEAGTLTISTPVTATSMLAIYGGQDVDIRNTATVTGAGGTLSIRAGRDILDNRAAAGADLTADNLVMLAGRNAGAVGNPIEIDANVFAGQAGTASNNVLVVTDLGNNVAGAASPNLTLGTLTTIQCTPSDPPVTVRGAQSDVVCLNANAGDLIIPGAAAGPVVGTTISLSAQNNVDLGQQITATNLAFIRAVTGRIIDNNGAGNIDVTSNQVALRQGSATTDLILTVAANTLAAFSGRGIQISDADGFTVGTVVDPCTTVTTTGVSATGDICLAATGAAGGITVSQNVTSTAGNVALGAAGDITFSGANGRVIAQGATNRVSLQSTGGNIVDNRNAVTSEVSANEVVLRAQNIGAPAGSDGALEIDAATVAAQATSPTGTVRLNDLTGNLVVGTLDTLTCGPNSPVVTINGVTSPTVTCVNTTGTLDLQSQVTGSTISLKAGADINLRNTLTTTGGAGTGLIAVDAGGTIIDSNGAANIDVTAGNVLLAARGATGDVILNVEADNLAATAGRNVNITDLTGFTVTSVTDPCFGTTVNGVTSTATGDICLAASNAGSSINIVEEVRSQGGNVAIYADTNINLNGPGTNTAGQVRSNAGAGFVSLVAQNGAINDNRVGVAPNLADVQAANVVMRAATSIGAAGNPLEINATNLAARANNGAANIEDIGGGLDVTTLSTIACGPVGATSTVGVTATGDVCVAATGAGSNLNVIQEIRSSGGNVAAFADTDINLNGAGTTGQIRSDSATGLASVVTQNGAINDNRVGTGAGIADIQATNLVMRAGTGIGAAGNPLEVDATNLAARANNGGANIEDIAGGVTVTRVTTLACGTFPATAVDGVTATADVCVAATGAGSNLNVVEDIRSSAGNVAVFADADINFNGPGNTAGQVRSDAAAGFASLVSQNGAINDNRVGLGPNLADVQATNVVMRVGTSIGAAGNPLEIDATNLATRAANGITALEDVAGGVTVTTLSTIACGVPSLNISGVISNGDVCLAATNGGSVTILQNIAGSAATTAAIFADQDIFFNGVANNGVVLSPGGTVSIVAQNGAIVDNRVGTGAFIADVSGTNVVLRAGTAIGAANNPLELVASNLAARANNGLANLEDLASNTTITSLSTLACGTFPVTRIDGVSATGDVCVAATSAGANLNLLEDIRSTAGNVAVFANTNLNLNGPGTNSAGQIRSDAANGFASVVTQNGAINDNRVGVAPSLADVQASNVVLRAGTAIGAAGNPLEIDATNLAVRAANGGANIEDVAGGATVTTLSTIACGTFPATTINGVTATADVCVAATGAGSSLTVREDIRSSGGNVAAFADTDLTLTGGGTTLGQIRSDAANGTASVVTQNGAIIDNRVGASQDVQAVNVVLRAGTDIGATGNPLELAANNLAARANNGMANLDVVASVGVFPLVATSLSTLPCGTFPVTRIDGVTATGDVCLAVTAIGNTLFVDEEIRSTNGNVAVFAQNNVLLRDNGPNTDGQIRSDAANGQASVVAQAGGIQDLRNAGTSAADIQANNVVMRAGTSIQGFGTDSVLEIDANNLAALGNNGVVNIQDVAGGVTVTTLTTANCGAAPTTITGVSAIGGDVCLAATGAGSDLNILETISASSFGRNVAVYADRNINFNNPTAAPNVGVVQSNGATASLVAQNGAIVDNRDATTTADVIALNAVLSAGTSIGAAGNPLEMTAGFVAARANNGGANLEVGINGVVTVTSLSTLACGPFPVTRIDGVSATGDVCVAASRVTVTDLTVLEDIRSSGGNVAVFSNGNINLNGVGTNTPGQIRSDAANGFASVVTQNGAINDNRAGAAPTLADIQAANVVLRAGTNIGAANNPLEVDATNLAARANNGIANLDDVAGGATVTSLTTIACGAFPATRIDGVTATGDVCVAATTSGDLILDEEVRSSAGNVALFAFNNINLRDAGPNTNGQVISGAANGVASLVAQNGAIQDNRVSIAPEPDIQATNVVLRAGTDIGGPPANNPLEIDATNLAAQSVNGMVNLDDVAGGVTVTTLNTIACGGFAATPITGVSGTGNVCVAATNSGDLNILQDIVSSGADVAVYAFRDVLFNGAAPAGQIRAAGTASVVAHNGSIVDNRGGATPDIVSTSLGIFTNGNVGTAAQPLELDVVNLAIRANGGGIAFTDTANGVTVTSISTLGCGDLPAGRIDGVTATNDVCLAAINGGSITVREDVASNTGNVALFADTDINLENGTNTAAQIRTDAANRTASLVTQNGSINDNRTTGAAADVQARDIVIRAGTDIGGATNPLEIDATNLAAQAVNGLANIDDVTGGVIVTTLNTIACGNFAATPIVGVTATGDVCVAATGGFFSIVIVQDVRGANASLFASNRIAFNGTATTGRVIATDPNGRASVVGQAGVNDNRDADRSADIIARDVVVVGGQLGTSGNSIEIDATNLAARGGAGGANFYDISGGVTVTTLTASDCGGFAGPLQVDGVTATGSVCVASNGGSVTILQDVAGTGGGARAAVYADQDVVFAGTATAGRVRAATTASVVANGGSIIDNRDADASADVSGPNVVLLAGNAIGAAANALELDANSLAARANNGVANLNDVAGGVTVTTLSTIDCGNLAATPVNGVTATGDVCVAATGAAANLNVVEEIRSSAGNVAAFATSDINLNGTGAVTAGQIRSDLANGLASVVTQNGAIHDNRVLATADVQAANVVLRAGTNIGANGNPLEIDATNLAARANNGLANIEDINGGVTVTSLSTIACGTFPVTRIDGVTATGDVCVAATGAGSSLNVVEEVRSSAGNVAVYADTDLNLNGPGNTAGQIRSDAANGFASLVAQNGAINDNRAGATADVQASNVVLSAATSIGGAGNPLEIDATNLAARANNGVANLDDVAGGVTVTSLSTLTCGPFPVTRIDGVSATGDVCVAASNSGDLIVDEEVRSSNGNVALFAFDNINLRDAGPNTNGQVISGVANGFASLVAQNGAIQDNRASTTPEPDIQATNVVLRAGTDIGGPPANNPLEIDATNLAARAVNGMINIDDVNGGVTVTTLSTLACGTFPPTAITGVSATGDVCVAATNSGDLTVLQDIESTNGNVGLFSVNSINLNGTAPAGQVRALNGLASLVAQNGTINDNRGGATADVVSRDLVISSAGSIGVAGNPLEIDAVNLAARANAGTVNINDVANGVTVTSLSTLPCGDLPVTRVDGVTASGDVCLAALNSGDITVREDVASDAGLVALYAFANINLQNGTNTQAQVRGTTASLVAENGAINDNRTTAGANEADVIATNVVMRASTGIGAAGNPLEIQATNLAAAGGTGVANIDDIGGGVTVTSLSTVACGTFPVTRIDGVSAFSDVCVAATNSGDLIVDEQIFSGAGNVGVYAFDNVNLRDNGPNTNGQIRSNGGNATASVVAQNGAIQDNRVSVAPEADVQAANIVLRAGTSIGAAGNPLEIDATNLAARAANGVANIDDVAGGVTVTSLSTIGCGDFPVTRIDGVTASGDVCVAATNSGSFTIREDVASDAGVAAVYAFTDINLENGTNTAAQVRSTTTASLVAQNGAINDNRTTLAPEADVQAANIVLRAGTSIGAAGNPLEIDATNLAARAANGGANIDDVAGGVTVTSLSTVGCGDFPVTRIDGATATGDVCVAATNSGSLTIREDVASDAGVAAVYAFSDINLENGTNTAAQVRSTTTASLVAQNGAINDNRTSLAPEADVQAVNVVLRAGTSIGAAGNPLEIQATNLAAQAVNGGANIDDVAGGVTVTTLSTIGCGDFPVTPIVGVSGTGDVCVAATNSGDLTILQDIVSSGGNVGVYAFNDINFNGVAPAGQVRAAGLASVVAQNGTINDNRGGATADIVANDLVISSAGSIGVAGNPLEIDAVNLAARANAGTININDVANGVTVTSLSTLPCGDLPVTRVDGVTASGDVCLAALNSGDVTVREDVASDAGLVALYAFANINLQNGTNTQAQVRGTTASLVAENGAINDNRTTAGANEADVIATNVVMRASTGIGAAGNPLEIQAANLAAAGGTGVANIDDIGGGVTVTSLSTVACGTFPVTRIDGVSAFSDVCVAATNSGDLIVDEQIFSGAGNVGVYAFNNVNLRDNGPNTNGQIRSNGGNATASVVAQNGAIQDNRVSVAPEADVQAANIVLRAGTSIGAAGNPLEIDATNLAARAANGVANIDDVAGGVTVTSLSTIGCGDFPVTRIDGVTASGDVCVAATNSGSLTIREDVASDAGVAAVYAFTDINLENGTNTAAQVRSTTTASLVALNGAINDNRTTLAPEADVQAANVVLRAGTSIGAAGNPLEIDATNLAARAANGGANIDDVAGGVTVTSLFTIGCGDFPATRIDGATATGDVCVAATNSGDLILDEEVRSSAGNAAVYAFGNVNLRDNGPNTNGQVRSDAANGFASVVAQNGSIQDNRVSLAPEADVQAANVVLRAGTSIGAAGNPLEIDATNLAARAANGVANIDDVAGGVTVTSLSTIACGDFPVTRIDGVTASGDVCVAATNSGSLTIREDVASDAGVAAVYAFTDINLENGTNTAAQVRSTTTASLVAQNGAINDNRTTLAPEADVQAANVVLRAATSIGAAGNPLEIDATNLAARAANGVANIDDVAGGVTVTSLSTIGCGDFPVTRIDGATATGDVCVAATNSGSLTIREDVASDAGLAAVYAFSDINLENGTNTAAQVRSTTTASLVAQNGAINDNRTTLAPEADVQAASVVLRAGTSIGAAGNPLEIQATNLAARAANGGANIDDVTGGVTVTSLTTIACGDFPATRIDGVTATGDVCVAATNSGDLILDEEVRSSAGNVAVYAFNNLNLRDGGPNTDGQIRSDAANGTASLVTQNGDMLDNRTGTDRADVRATNIVARSAQNVGVVGNPLEIDGTNLAARANNGTAIIDDIAGGITITTLNTIGCGDFPATPIAGVSATGEVCVSATNSGDLTVLQDVVSQTADASLYAFNSINFNGTAPAGQVRAANTVSLVADRGSINDNRAGNTADVQATSLAMRANGDIGGTNNPLEIAVSNLAGRSDTGMINVLDLNGGVTITTVSTSACGGVAPEAIQGLRAATDVCVDAQGGDIVLDQPVVAGRDAALRASNNLELNQSVTATRTASLEAGNGIHDNNDANAVDVQAQNVVMLAQNEIGTMANPIEYQTNLLAVQSVNNSVFLNGLGNTVTIGELTTLKGNVVVSGVRAGAEICIDQLSSGIIVDKPVVAGTQVALQASGDILLNEFVQAAALASIRSVTGSISDNNDAAVDVRAQNVVMAAQGSVGSEANSIDIEATNLAVRAVTGDVGINDTSGSLCVTTIGLLKGAGDVVGVSAGRSVFIQTEQDLLLELVQAGTNAHLVSKHGSIIDKNGPAPNVIAGSGANLEACEGFIGSRSDALDVAITGDLRVDSHFSVLEGTVTGSIIVGPCADNPVFGGLFNGRPIGGTVVDNSALANDSVFLGENRAFYPFYQNLMFNYLDNVVDNPVVVRYVSDDYDFLRDLDFLLHKKADGEAIDINPSNPTGPDKLTKR